MMEIKSLSDIVPKIAKDPCEWVLVIGDSYFDEKAAGHGDKILKLAKKYKENITVTQGFYGKVMKDGYAGITNELFGNVWNGTSFLDEHGWGEMERRKEYAHMFKQKERVNIDYAKVDIRKLLEIFSGIILTVCRDESVEAFWENEKSMLVDENVWTPYSLVMSAKWNRWRKYSEGSRKLQIESYFGSGESNIFKLYGSCRTPHQMLLSQEDFELYYPVEESDRPSTKLLLQELFQNKNLFILGEDIYCMENYRLPFAPGIARLLKKPTKIGVERYIFTEGKEPEGGWESYHIIPLEYEKDSKGAIQGFADEILKKKQEKPEGEEEPDKIDSLEEAERLFWELYIRRSKDGVSEREKYILKQQLLRINDRESLHLLSAAANNQADFYDLENNIKLAEKNMEDKGQNPKDYKKVLLNILCDRLGKKSLQLLRLLSFYGEGEDFLLGFPLGFLQLLAESNDELREWKRAGFQLTNSAIYVRRHYRKHLHKRMEYADSIMQTAGTNPNKVRMKNIIEEIGHQLDDSYFYPVDKKYFKITEFSNEDKIGDKTVEELFIKMFRKLLEVLKEKQDGYNHIRSLLETEINTIIHKIGELEDENLEWKPELIYYLLRESRVIPKESNVKGLDSQLDKLLDALEKREGEKRTCDILYKIILARQSKGLIKSQSSYLEDQNAALEECRDAERLLEEIREICGRHEAGLFPKKIFNQALHLYLLESKIHGRRSMLVEMERCWQKKEICMEQERYLADMDESLKKAEEILKERKEVTGSLYEDLQADLDNHKGEYYFKMSQYYWENRRYRKESKEIQEEETSNYDAALGYYQDALSYYKKFPYQYLIQRADVMRNIADLYYRRAESEGRAETKRQCYEYLAEAYKLYRSNADLHGIADVLQSMGNAETIEKRDGDSQNAEEFKKNVENTRSELSFYDASTGLYGMLGDQWSYAVAARFREGIPADSPAPADHPRQ